MPGSRGVRSAFAFMNDSDARPSVWVGHVVLETERLQESEPAADRTGRAAGVRVHVDRIPVLSTRRNDDRRREARSRHDDERALPRLTDSLLQGDGSGSAEQYRSDVMPFAGHSADWSSQNGTPLQWPASLKIDSHLNVKR